ncbi:MAG: twin-arginine translocation signal domain-containing protein, partial [Chitinophagaceae bacterium]
MENKNLNSRRDFIRKASLATGAFTFSAMGLSARSYSRILGSNDRVQVGIIGFS